MRWPYMGFMEKVKNLFTEEEEVPVEPVKKEVIQVEIPAPAEEKTSTPKRETTVEVEEEKKEEKFSFPVFFDDKDFESLEKPKVEKKKEKKNAPVVKREDAYQAKGIHYEEKKVFKPSPIISPVYGILDKNYKKEEISNKTAYTDESYHKPHKLDIDDVRNKAFGTLEDDIDTAFTEEDIVSMSRETYHDQTPDLEEDLLDDLKYDEGDENPLDILSDEKKSTAISDDFDMLDDAETLPKHKSENNMVEAAMNDDSSSEEDLNLNESDLFNLIDSMYEKRDEE